jgi:hypothetical protein
MPIKNNRLTFRLRVYSCITTENKYILEIGDESEARKVLRYSLNFPTYKVCVNWENYQKNVSTLLSDPSDQFLYANCDFVDENPEPLVCRLKVEVIFNTGQSMGMFHEAWLMRRVNEIIDRVVAAGLYNYCMSLIMIHHIINSQKIAIIHPLNGYYIFKLYNMQPAFYRLLICWCLSVFLSKRR